MWVVTLLGDSELEENSIIWSKGIANTVDYHHMLFKPRQVQIYVAQLKKINLNNVGNSVHHFIQ